MNPSIITFHEIYSAILSYKHFLLFFIKSVLPYWNFYFGHLFHDNF